MSNPFDPPVTTETQSVGIRRPWLISFVVTFLSISIWFGFLRIPLYSNLSILALAFVPALNSLAIAPLFAYLTRHSITQAIVLHVIVILLILGGPFYWPSIVRQVPILRWTMQPAYWLIILAPPILFGSLWYSIIFNRRSQQRIEKT